MNKMLKFSVIFSSLLVNSLDVLYQFTPSDFHKIIMFFNRELLPRAGD